MTENIGREYEPHIYEPHSEGTNIADIINDNQNEPEPVYEKQIKEPVKNYYKKPRYEKPINKAKKHVKKIKDNDYFYYIVEFLILLTVYIVMSQEFFINNTSKYIKQLNQQQDGTISFTGIIIYGVLLSFVFMVIRKVTFEYAL
jgi:hypothetical protein